MAERLKARTLKIEKQSNLNVGYRYGKDAQEVERMDDLEFIARVVSHIPDKGQVTARYYGLYANAHRGKVKNWIGLSTSPARPSWA